LVYINKKKKKKVKISEPYTKAESVTKLWFNYM